MPQLVPFLFINQVSYGFLALFCLVFIMSRYILPLWVQLLLTRKALELSPKLNRDLIIKLLYNLILKSICNLIIKFDLFIKFIYKLNRNSIRGVFYRTLRVVFYRTFHLFDLFIKLLYKLILRTGTLFTFFLAVFNLILTGFNDFLDCYIHNKFSGFIWNNNNNYYYYYYYILKCIHYYILKGIYYILKGIF
jgi:F-type H+-transporting ATPase subunit 8